MYIKNHLRSFTTFITLYRSVQEIWNCSQWLTEFYICYKLTTEIFKLFRTVLIVYKKSIKKFHNLTLTEIFKKFVINLIDIKWVIKFRICYKLCIGIFKKFRTVLIVYKKLLKKLHNFFNFIQKCLRKLKLICYKLCTEIFKKFKTERSFTAFLTLCRSI